MIFSKYPPQAVEKMSLSANFIVATPHCGARSLKFENDFFEISAAGGRKNYSHSMQSNAFSLILVSPVRSRDSDSTDYLYSPCSTASVYQFFISVIKRLFCRGSRGIIPLESLYNISGLPSSKRDHLRRDFFGATIHDRQCFRGNVS